MPALSDPARRDSSSYSPIYLSSVLILTSIWSYLFAAILIYAVAMRHQHSDGVRPLHLSGFVFLPIMAYGV